MAGNKITYTLDFRANLTDVQGQLNKLSASLNAVASKRIVSPNASQDIRNAANAASILEMNLKKAFNADTGKLNLTKFNMEIKNSGHNLQTLTRQLLGAGQSGRQAFMQMSIAIANSQKSMIKAGGAAQALWTTLKNTARWQISSAALTGLISGISSAIRYVKDLNKSLTDIRIVSGDSADEMARFAKEANRAAKELGATTLDVTNASLIYRQQGDDLATAAKKAEITIKAANVATEASAEEMSNYLTAIWNSYKVGSEEMELYVDKLSKVGAITAVNMSELATASEKVASTANTVGVSYDQLLATIATVGTVTRQSAETIGTAFKTIYARMGDLKLEGETEGDDGYSVTLGEVSEKLDLIGIHVLDANGNMRDMGTIVEDLGEKWQTLTDAEKQATAQVVAGKRQYTHVMALFENWDYYKNVLNETADAQGTLNEQNEIFAESWEAASNRVKDAWQKVIMNLNTENGLIDLINGFGEVIEVVGDVVESIGGIKGVLLLLGSIFTKVYANNIANGLKNMAMGFLELTGLSKFYNASILEAQQSEINSQNILQQEYQEQLNLVYKLAQATNEFNARKKGMSETRSFIFDYDLKILNQQIQGAINSLNELREEQQRLSQGHFELGDIDTTEIVITEQQLKRLGQQFRATGGDFNILRQNFSGNADMLNVINQLQNRMEGLDGEIDETKNSMANLSQEVDKFQHKIGQNKSQAIKELKDDIRILEQTIQYTRNELEKLFTVKSKKGASNSTKLLISDFQQAGYNIEIVKQKFMELNQNDPQAASKWNVALNDLKNSLGYTNMSLDQFIALLIKLQGQLDKDQAEVEELKKQFEKLKNSKFGPGITEQFTQVASAIMNVSMMLTNIKGMIDSAKEGTFDFSQALMTIPMLLMSIVSAFNSLKIAADSAKAAIWWLIAISAAITAIGLAWNYFDEQNISLKEAQENLEKLNGEFKTLNNELDETKKKQKNLEDLGKEYLSLKDKANWAELTEDETKRLGEVSQQLTEQYGIETSSLNSLRGSYDEAKGAILEYVDALKQERLEKEREIIENRKDTIKNKLAEIDKTGSKTLHDKQFGHGSGNISGSKVYSDEEWSALWKFYHEYTGLDYEEFEKDFKVQGTLSGTKIQGQDTDRSREVRTAYNDFIKNEINSLREKTKKEIRGIMGDLIKVEAGDSVDDIGLQLLNQGVNEFLEGDSKYAREIMSDPDKAGWYAASLGKFAEEYSGNIRDIVAVDKKIKEKISSGEGLSSKNYEEYFNNIEKQAGILKAKFDKGLIDADAYRIESEKLRDVLHQDAALTLEFIEQDESFGTLGTGFEKFQGQVIKLTNNFNTGKITQEQYFKSLVDNLDNATTAFGENKKAAAEYFSSIVTQGKNALNSLISSYENGNISTNQFMDKMEEMSDYFVQLQEKMELYSAGSSNDWGLQQAGDKLKELKEQLNDLQSIFPKISREAKKSSLEVANALESVGITTQDVKDYVAQYSNEFTQAEQDAVKSAETTEKALIASGDQYGTAQAVALQKYKTLMGQLGTQIGSIITGVMEWLKSFKVKLVRTADGGYEFQVEGAKGDISKSDWEKFKNMNKDQYNFKFKGGDAGNIDWTSRGAEWYAEGMTEEELYNLFHEKDGNETKFVSRWGIEDEQDYNELTQGFYNGQQRGYSGLTVTIANRMYDTTIPNLDNLDEIPNPLGGYKDKDGDGKGEERKYDNTIEAQIRDILDKNTGKLEKKLEQQQQYGELLDAEIDGWHNVLINQEQIVKTNEDLYKAELKNKEDLNKLLNDTLDEYGFDLPTISTWFGEDFEATEFFINLKNSKGTNDEAEVIQKIFDDYQKIFKALDETETRTQELLQLIKSSRDELLSGYEDYYNYELDQLKEIQDQIKWEKEKIIDSLKDEIDLKNDLINLEKKHNDAMKELRTTQREINKNLFDSKMNVQWLDKETRELMFNQNDYYKVTSKISDIQNYLKENYIEYQNKIAELDDDELYKADLLTKEYESQVEAKKEELAILKSSLNIEKQRNALNNSLMEKNVRVFAGGRWRQVANVEEVTKAYQEYQESINETLELQAESAENEIIREQEATVRDLESLQKMYQQQITMMDEAIEELEHEWKLSTSLVHNIREVTLKDFQDAVKTMTEKMKWASANYNAVKSSSGAMGTFNSISGGGGSSSGGGGSYDTSGPVGTAFVPGLGNVPVEIKDGKTQSQLPTGSIVHTAGGDFKITGGTAGNYTSEKIEKNARGRKDGPGGISQVNELGIELLATNGGQFIELNPHEKIFNNEQMNFLYDFSRRGIESTEKAVSSVSAYNDESMTIENLTLELPNVTDTNSFVEGLKGLKEHMRNVKTIR